MANYNKNETQKQQNNQNQAVKPQNEKKAVQRKEQEDVETEE